MADINEQDEVLEFEDDGLPELPDDNPFEENKPRRTWLYVGIGVVVLSLVTAVVLKLVSGGKHSGESIVEIPVEEAGQPGAPVAAAKEGDFVQQANKLVETKDTEKPAGMPERVVEERKDVTFNPDKPTVQRPKPRPVAAAKTEQKAAPATKQVSVKSGVWSVQVGSYNSHAAAESGQRGLQNSHKALFTGHDFSILSAVLPNGKTTYRLRVVGFENSNDANGFCKNAQKEGVSCYVAR